jgi:hypothetical protein
MRLFRYNAPRVFRRGKRKLRKIRIAILKAITWIAGVFFFVSILALDMESLPIPVTVTVASGIWLTLIALANN